MEIEYLEENKNRVKVEIKGEGHTLCNPLVKELWQDKNVGVAGYHIDHSLISNPILVIESSGDAKGCLKKAINRLGKKIKEMDDKFKKAK